MVEINEQKKTNSVTLLADRFEIGSSGQALTYKDLSGVLGNLLSNIRSYRTAWLSSSPENLNKPFPPFDPDMMKSAIESVAGKNSKRSSSSDGKAKIKDEEQHAKKAIEEVLVDTDDEMEESPYHKKPAAAAVLSTGSHHSTEAAALDYEW
jgi:tryptophanyl-tRNA synthetase